MDIYIFANGWKYFDLISFICERLIEWRECKQEKKRAECKNSYDILYILCVLENMKE